ncbi:MAG: Peptidase M23 family protein [Parcubacteria group bacterium GW2011_GWA2_51_10]|nr:MAG: Peptidase M23 family protein [Parcubacteria group bacterium GW2011_GWA2_51_10]
MGKQGAETYSRLGTPMRAISLISLLIMVGSLLPNSANASLLSDFLSALRTNSQKEELPEPKSSLQVMPLLRPAMNIDPAPARGGGDITIIDDTALLPEEGPSGTIADIDRPKNAAISVYVVRDGDTISGIAKMFDVSPSTILWANSDIPRGGKLKVGEMLTILPVTGVKYTVKKGDTLAAIAKRHGGDADEIARFNEFSDGPLSIGTEIIIPDGEIAAVPASVVRPRVSRVPSGSTASQIGYYLRPLVGGLKTQGIHGYNGVDLAAPNGASILASAAGSVIVSKQEGWNGGYGKYIVIQHANGTQTLYAHNSQNIVSVGQNVVQGQVIGYVGSTGKSTGSHVHFEIRNGIRNPF